MGKSKVKRQESGNAGKAATKGLSKVELLQRKRDEARAKKDWDTADAIRDQLKAAGVAIQDTYLSGGTGGVKGDKKQKRKKKKKAKKAAESDEEEEEEDEVGAALQEQPAKKGSAKVNSKEQVLAKGVRALDVRIGDGPEVIEGRRVRVAYVGRLESMHGAVFDRSAKGDWFAFKLGRGDVIQGWDIGVVGMKVGGIRKLTVPPNAAYGKKGIKGTIPPDSTLVFEVTVRGM